MKAAFVRTILLGLLGICLIGSAASARTPAKSQAKPAKVKATVSESSSTANEGGRFGFSVFYSMADQVSYQGRADLFSGPTRFTATDRTSSALGLGASYFYRRDWSLGYEGALAYELPRSSKGLSADVGGTQIQGQYVGDPKISVVTALANANFSLGWKTYLFAGANYPLVLTKKSGADLSGLLGYQAGIGYAASEQILVEAAYREVKMDGTINSGSLVLKVREANFPGALFSVRYLF